MIHLALTDTHLYCVQWSKTEADVLLTSLAFSPFQHPIGEAVHSETEFVSVFSAALHQISESISLEGETVYITLPDHWCKSLTLPLDGGLTEADGWDLIQWTVDQRWGPEYSKKAVFFGRFFNENSHQIFGITTLSEFIEPLKLSIVSLGANPVWMGTETSAFYGLSPVKGITVFIPETGHYRYAAYASDGFSFGTCRKTKDHWKFTVLGGHEPTFEKPIYIAGQLSEKRSQHFTGINYEPMTPFPGINMEGVTIPDEVPEMVKLISSALMTGVADQVSINFLGTPGIQDNQYEEKPAIIETEDISAEKKTREKRKRKRQVKKKNRQTFASGIVTLIILIIFSGVIFMKQGYPLEENINGPVPTVESEPAPLESKEADKTPVYSKILGKYFENSQSILNHVLKIFEMIPSDKLVFLTMSNGSIQLEMVGGEVMDTPLDSIGTISNYSLTEINCCGGYKHGYSIEPKVFEAPFINNWIEIDTFLAKIKKDSSFVQAKYLAPRPVGDYLQNPVILRLTNQGKIIEFLEFFKVLSDNIALEKVSYFSNTSTKNPIATLYLSLFEDIPESQQE